MTVARDPANARSIDGIDPGRTIRPEDAAGVASAIGEANEARQAVVLWGGGTRIAIGDAPSRYDIALNLTGVAGIVEHAPADLVCTARAGTTLAELATALARAGQRWPVDAPYPERATVGGTIASATAPPPRLRFQHPRDWVIGCEAVLGDGTRARAGGRVVKNVTGFDLTRLYSGTYGTLVALVEVSLKLVAVDEAVRTFRRYDADVARLAAIASALRVALPLEAIALVSGAAPALYVRVAGSAAAVERVAREVTRAGLRDEVATSEWADVVDAPARETNVARCAVPPGQEADAIGASGLAYVGTGVAYRFGEREEELRTLRSRCEAMGGALVLERGAADLRRRLGTWGRSRVPPAIARDLKARFDPHAVLAPGRIPV